ncbi:transcription initiation factor TFIID subunit 3 [Caerostris extrusa]|uniref:Transcription initiation factor TFIID subunit 3 n=1 Tax=Caerostris extrusa TaxID=172846 RepID=A0AAV4QYE6_CAEEX|nr:transcription initiation factor TFIID subunit 3 [Caerostris extrusa]
MKEVSSVFLTPTGFISPVHEGKVAESSLPCLVDSPPPTPENPTHSGKKDVKLKDSKKDKSKSKKEGNKKDVKKIKSSKKEKENKENAVGKHEKLVTTSSSSKKEHSTSHKTAKVDKSVKSDEPIRQKSKSDKMKLKSQKDEIRKIKESFKHSKMKAKLKHSGGSSSSSHIKSSKLSCSKKLKAAKLAKSLKHLKDARNKSVEPEPDLPSPSPVPELPKEIPVEEKLPVEIPKVMETEIIDEPVEEEELDFNQESPESRLVIDDSLETQARQERESRLEVIDECIEAVIRRGEEESEIGNRAMDDTINSVVRGPVTKKLDKKDIYEFNDTSDSSSLSSCDMPPHFPISLKKEKKTVDTNKKPSESPKRSKKDNKKKGNKDSKAKSPTPYSTPPRSQKSSFMLKVDDRTPSPILRDDLLSSDGSTPGSSPRSSTFFDHSPPSHIHAPPLLSQIPSLPSPLVPPSSTFTSSPFAPIRPCHTNPHFPTPPLFVTPNKSESGTSFQNMPLNLAKSGPSSQKSSPEKTESTTAHSTVKSENSDLIKKAANIMDKAKAKEHKKERFKRKWKKDSEKTKKKEDKEESRDKEKPKAKEKPKIKKEEKNVKTEKKKSKPEKKKAKLEEKVKEDKDSTVPKMTLKFSGATGSAKICVKPNTKTSTSLSSSPSPSHDSEDEHMRTPSPPVRIPTPSPPRAPTPPPPPPPRIPTPPPPSPPPPPPPVVKETKMDFPLPGPPPPISTTKTQHSRGRGRGKKAATAPAARTVITETVGTIIDECGNKIWICPACSRADDGSPMIGCDECDDWYHWICVGIVVPPKEEENWFCVRCLTKRQGPSVKRRRKKHKKDK